MRVARATPPQRPPGPEHTGVVYYCGRNETLSTGDRVVYGAKGVVTGPATLETHKGGLKVQFEGNTGWIDLRLDHLSLTPPPAELIARCSSGEPRKMPTFFLSAAWPPAKVHASRSSGEPPKMPTSLSRAAEPPAKDHASRSSGERKMPTFFSSAAWPPAKDRS